MFGSLGKAVAVMTIVAGGICLWVVTVNGPPPSRPPAIGLEPALELVGSKLRCGQLAWLNQYPASPAGCLALVRTQLASICSHSHCVYAAEGDRNCGCVPPPPVDCDKVTSPDVVVASWASLYRAVREMPGELSAAGSRGRGGLTQVDRLFRIDHSAEEAEGTMAAPQAQLPLERGATASLSALAPLPGLPAAGSITTPDQMLRPLPARSEHMTVGKHLMPKGSTSNNKGSLHASYYFKNLCVGPGKGIPPRGLRTRGHFEWYYVHDGVPPPDGVNFTLGVGPHTGIQDLQIAPTLVSKQAFDSEFPAVRYETILTTIFHEYNAENFGHMVADVMMPIFALMYIWDLLQPEVQLLRFATTHPPGHNCDYQANPGWGNADWVPGQIQKPAVAARCKLFYKKLMPGVSRRPVVVMDELFNQSKTPVCFERLLVGQADLSDDCQMGGNGIVSRYKGRVGPTLCNVGKTKLFWDYRAFVKHNLAAPEVPPTRQHLVVQHMGPGSNRGDRGGQGPNNATEIAENMQRRFPQLKISIVDFAPLSFADQVRVIGDATVHIVTGGGASFIGLWLPRHATQIRLGRENGDYGMDHQLFSYLGYIAVDYFKIDPVYPHTLNFTDLGDSVRLGMTRYEAFAPGAAR